VACGPIEQERRVPVAASGGRAINPKDLLLDLIVHEPIGGAPDVITEVEARYEETTEFEYETVTIVPDGPTIPVQPLG